MTIGIASTGVYIPENVMTAEDIVKKSGLPLSVVKNKMGITQKPIPGPEDHTVAMAIKAAEKALQKGSIDPKLIDLIIYIGEEHKEYPLWTAAIKIQEELGAYHAWGFDVALRCGTTIMAMKVAKSLMESDPTINTVLLAGGYRNSDLIDYTNERTRFMFNLGAGGAAMILKKNYYENTLLESDLITDGSFSEDVLVPVGGTKEPLTSIHLEQGLYRLDVMDPVGMKARLEQKSMQNFLLVIRNALMKSGYSEKDINYLGILHMKKSAHDFVLNELGLTSDQSIYLSDYGHIGQMDQIISLELAQEAKKLKNGDLVVLVSAGIGYAWEQLQLNGEIKRRVYMSLPKIQLSSGDSIAYRVRSGGEETIVLVHGNMTSSKHWDVLLERLDKRFSIYAIDLRGFGESTYHNRIQGIKDFANDLSEIVNALDLQNFYLIGWSTGGAISMQYVVDHPGRCEKLVLLASASTRGYPFYGVKEDGTPDLNRRLKTIEEIEENPTKTLAIQGLYDTGNKEGLKAVWNAAIYTHKKPDETAYEEYVNDMLTQRNLADVYHALNTFNISGTNNGLSEGTDQAKQITIPVLILRGDRDYVVSEEMTQEIVADLGENATYIPLIDSGHSPLIDDLEQLTDKIEAFL